MLHALWLPEITIRQGLEVTAFTESDSLLKAADLPMARENASELSEMMNLLPPRVLNGEGREGDMLNLIFVAQEDELQEAFARRLAESGEIQTTNHLASAMPA